MALLTVSCAMEASALQSNRTSMRVLLFSSCPAMVHPAADCFLEFIPIEHADEPNPPTVGCAALYRTVVLSCCCSALLLRSQAVRLAPRCTLPALRCSAPAVLCMHAYLITPIDACLLTPITAYLN